MKYKNMTKKEILNQFYHDRNSSKGTQKLYHRAVTVFEEWSIYSLEELLQIADHEETKNISWKNSTLKPLLIDYRKYLYDKYSERTAESYLTKIMTILKHYEITIPPLPYFSTKNIKKTTPIYADDLPTREILLKAIQINDSLLTAIVSLMSSTGLSRIDTLNLTVGDYMESTNEYHRQGHIQRNILDMQDSEVDIIPTFYLSRQKTGEDYFTFASPESVVNINAYLWQREDKLTPESKLFKVHERYFNLLFQRTNDILELGRINNRSRFSPQMLRRYHATQLMEAGMSTDKINILQGRKNHDVANMSYIKYRPSKMKKEYIEALPYVVIEEISQVKTELEVTKQQLDSVSSENILLKQVNNDTRERLEKLESIVFNKEPTWEEFIDQ